VTVQPWTGVRQEKAAPIIDALHTWMIAQRQLVPEGSAIAKALDYSLKRWMALSVGGGTSADVARDMGLRFFGTDLHQGFNLLVDDLKLRIPRPSGHLFHEHPATDSTVIRPPVPRSSDHP
jgi:Transposase IS66 family